MYFQVHRELNDCINFFKAHGRLYMDFVESYCQFFDDLSWFDVHSWDIPVATQMTHWKFGSRHGFIVSED